MGGYTRRFYISSRWWLVAWLMAIPVRLVMTKHLHTMELSGSDERVKELERFFVPLARCQ